MGDGMSERPYPASCPLCRAEGSPNGLLIFPDEWPRLTAGTLANGRCKWHPQQELERVEKEATSDRSNRAA